MNEFIQRTPSIMKSCLKEYWDNWIGDPTRQDNRKTVSWFVLEYHRMGYSKEDIVEEILLWADAKYPNLTPRKEENLRSLVLKILKDPYELGCPSNRPDKPYQSKLSDICFREERKCPYDEEFKQIRQKLSLFKIDETVYNKYGWPEILQDASSALGLYADLIYRILRELEAERGIPIGGIIFVGLRTLATRIVIKRKGFPPEPMTVLRTMWLLETEGLITIAQKGKARGKSAKSKPKAHGYCRVIPIPCPAGSEVTAVMKKMVVTHT